MATLLLWAIGGSACAAPSLTNPSLGTLGGTLGISFIPNQVSQGQGANFAITLPVAAYAGGAPLVFTFSGEATGVDTLVIPQDSAGLPIDGDIQVPATAPDGVLNVEISLPTIGGQSASATLTIKDTEAPTLTVGSLSANVDGFAAGNVLLAGRTDSIAVNANDNHALAWVGWSITSPVALGDSVPVSGVASSVSLPIAIPASLAGDSLAISLFAADSDGNVVTISQPRVLVARVTTHPVKSVPRGARVSDIAFDSARGMMYLAKPDSQIVAVLSLASLSYQSPIPVNGRPVAVDLSPGGDSLIVGLASPAAAAVVSLASPAHPVIGTLSFGSPDSLTSLRVTADDQVLAYVNHGAVQLDLTTGIAQVADSSTGGCLGRVTRSGDHTRSLLLNCPTAIYSSTTHSYMSAPSLASGGGGVNTFTSANASGAIVYQVEHVLLDSTITAVFAGGQDSAYGAAVAPNGVDFYVGEGGCTGGGLCPDSVPGLYLHYVRPTTSPVEISIVPHPAYELAVDRTGNTLIGLTADTIFAVDLTQSTAAQIAQRHRPATTVKHSSRRAARATARCAQRGAFQFELQLPGTMRCVARST
jgi:hypothetical protein